MTPLSNNYSIAIYNEAEDIERKNQDYKDYLSLLTSTNIIYLRKEGSDWIFIGVSGINCKKGNSQANSFFFSKTLYPKSNLLSGFYKSLEMKRKQLGLTIDNDDFNKLFESESDKKNVDLPSMMAPIMDNIDLIKSLTIIPSYHIPKEHVLDILEYTINSDKFNSAAYSFRDMELKGIAPDILFYNGVENKIIPTRETEEAIKAEELKRKTKQEEEQKVKESKREEEEFNCVSKSLKSLIEHTENKINELCKKHENAIRQTIPINNHKAYFLKKDVLTKTIEDFNEWLCEELENINKDEFKK
ncbi:MAG: hypothetical protein Q8P40_03045, partial [Nitrospirota bacterium]|nr:hypothetical protein [Nitrospirota bacterium]